ncbi:hypothetical protein [Sulfitobacter mediterraneus]|uniref:hypothetical protein n=1 Tax=Sulfitobacter mediterraneus TaxID=83219 RepID=UPI0021A8C265|nr:hypothetical protein [Sulfitobacter mediterraneus]UWR10620.1 hypothetical protein K3753_15405 [Sulfitobacter mediterraneus]
MPLFTVALLSVFLFFMYMFASRLRQAVMFLVLFAGYQTFSYLHYFRGSWGASGNANPFNEELMFSMITLSFVATCFGFLAWVIHDRRKVAGKGPIDRLRTFVPVFGVFVLIAITLVLSIPLSFEMPINLKRCDGSVGQPDYCT